MFIGRIQLRACPSVVRWSLQCSWRSAHWRAFIPSSNTPEVVEETSGKAESGADYLAGIPLWHQIFESTLKLAHTWNRDDGYHVLMHAKRNASAPKGIQVRFRSIGDTGSGSLLEVRATLAADLNMWLHLPPEHRGEHFFEFDWATTDWQAYYQGQRQALLGADDSQIVECTFSTVTHPTDDQPISSKKVAHIAHVYAAGLHIGELRTNRKRRSDEPVRRIFDGQHRGLARLQRWPDNIELRVCVPDATGHLQEFSGPFLWRAQREEAEIARLTANWEAIDAEKVDGQSLSHCKKILTQLKRADDLEAARTLALKMVEAAEHAGALTQQPPREWVTLEAAIVLRKLNDRAGEIDVLERYLRHCPPGAADGKISERLAKLR